MMKAAAQTMSFRSFESSGSGSVLQNHGRSMMLKPGAAHGANQRQHDGGGKQRPVHIALPDEAGGGKHRADTGREFIGTQCVVNRELAQAHEVGRHRDDSAAACNGVHKGAKEHTGADQQHDPQRHTVHGDLRQK